MSTMRQARLWPIVFAMVAAIAPARAQDRLQDHLNVVASFSILGDFVRNVGGDRVNVTTLVGANGDVHVYTPAPGDAKKVADARLLVVNGLGLEGWLPRVLQSSGGQASIVTATKGITPLQIGAASDPHAWQSVANAKIYVANICDALVAVDPADAAIFRANAQRYLAELGTLDREVKAAIEKIPPERRKVVTTHNGFGYFGAAYGVQFIAALGASTETEPSARDIGRIISTIRTAKIPAVFLENLSDDRLIRRIAAETGTEIGGTLFSDALTGEKGEAPTYIALVRHNIRVLTNALALHK